MCENVSSFIFFSYRVSVGLKTMYIFSKIFREKMKWNGTVPENSNLIYYKLLI